MELPGPGPIYERLCAFYRRLIELGAYQEGSFLPSAREVAANFGINPNTAARALRSLEEDGYVVAIERKGYMVRRKSNASGREARLRALLAEIVKEGYSIEEIGAALKEEGK